MSIEQLSGMPFMQQGVRVWGSRDVSGGRAGKCLARGRGRAWFSASARVHGQHPPTMADFNLPLCCQRGWRVQRASHPAPAHHWLEVKCWDSRQGSKLRLQQMPSLRVRTGELEWGRGDHRQRTVPPVVGSPPEEQLVWRASALRQASYMSPLLTHTPGVGAIINLVLYVGDCSIDRSGNFHEVTEEA